MHKCLKNVGSIFSRMMKTVLENQTGRNIITYIDDIVIASKNKEHLVDLVEIFANIHEAKLHLELENVPMESVTPRFKDKSRCISNVC
jgi:hypothetical protein